MTVWTNWETWDTKPMNVSRITECGACVEHPKNGGGWFDFNRLFLTNQSNTLMPLDEPQTRSTLINPLDWRTRFEILLAVCAVSLTVNVLVLVWLATK